MSIKGTLESFNLCELLQMLAFNQKEGTLVLDSEDGARTLYLDKGTLTFLEGDAWIAASIARMAKRHQLASEGRIDEAVERSRSASRPLHTVLEGMGLLDAESAGLWFRDAVIEQLFEAQLTSVAGFEFVEGKALGPDGAEGRPIRPSFPVESLLLDLARQLDDWNTIIEVVPSPHEIYEGTGIGVDLAEDEEIEEALAEVVIPRIDGYRSLGQIAEASHATLFAVMQIAATLFEGGGIRAVPTQSLVGRAEDLLARGEAGAAVPLLQRGIERGDAPVEARLRLADAHEATGMLEDAAAALDTYAALSDDDDAPAVFDALCRALRMREGDLATAARVCDYYLRRRPWLQEYRSMAASALRDLIHGATTNGRPLEAATRLEEFIKVGDSPTADRTLLADLYAAGGDSERAGAVLFEEAKALLEADKRIPARQTLRKVLEYDGGHADARRQLLEMDGARKRTHHRARVVGILLALALVAGGAGVAWFGYRDSASVDVGDAESHAQLTMARAEGKARELVAVFTTRVRENENAVEEDEALAQDAKTLRREVTDLMATTMPALAAYGEEIEKYAASGNDGTHRAKHETLSNRRMLVTNQIEALLREYGARAQQAYKAGKSAHAEGQFEEARKQFRLARNLAFENTNVRNDAVQKLTIVDEYYGIYEKYAEAMQKATDARDFKKATEIGLEGLKELLDSDLSRALAFPLRVTSNPPGAEIWIGDEDTGARTPCELTYSPFLERPVLTLRQPGCCTRTYPLPDYKRIRRGEMDMKAWQPEINGTMKSGVRWRQADGRGQLSALWKLGQIPVVVANRGRNLMSVDPISGLLTQGSTFDASDGVVRMGGRLEGGAQWSVHGQRTLRVQPPGGTGWVTQTVGRIEHPPIEMDEYIIFVDQVGMLYAHAIDDGEQRWRAELGVGPSQQPFASPMGILMGTVNGNAYKIGTERGEVVALAPSVRGSTFVFPFGDEAVVLGGGTGGYRVVDADGNVRTMGDARPRFDRTPSVTSDGVIWTDGDGAVRFLRRAGDAPVRVGALGTTVQGVTLHGNTLYATTTDGSLRAASLTNPDQLRFEVALGGRVESEPLTVGSALFVLVDGQLVAVEI